MHLTALQPSSLRLRELVELRTWTIPEVPCTQTYKVKKETQLIKTKDQRPIFYTILVL
jgi:hypothetical protein